MKIFVKKKTNKQKKKITNMNIRESVKIKLSFS